MVNIALLLNERAFASSKLAESLELISLTDYREFSVDDPQIETYLQEMTAASDVCENCSTPLPTNSRFCSQCGTRVTATGSIIAGLLDETINSLSISMRMKTRVRPKFPKVGDIVQASREEIMQIPYIKEVRSRMLKNAADEFISG